MKFKLNVVLALCLFVLAGSGCGRDAKARFRTNKFDHAREPAAEGPLSVRTPRSSGQSSGTSSAAELDAARKANGAARTPDRGQGGTDSERRSIAKDAITRILEGNYLQSAEVVTGRFLREFDQQILLLAGVDSAKLQPSFREKDWAEVRAPYAHREILWKHRTHLSVAAVRLEDATVAIIRLEKKWGTWKIENIRVR